jgi:hypothetical protein
MKRATVLFSLFVPLLALSMASCDSMFSTNIFAKLTHPALSAADIASMTPAQMEAYASSTENMQQLADNPELKAAALANLEATYGNEATTGDQQTAAIVAADISIQTVPDAAELSSLVQSALISGSSLSITTSSDATSFIESVLPKDIQASVSPGAPMPANFEAMIEAYQAVNGAYQALGAGVGADGDYAAGLDLSSSEKADIAVNAVIAGLIGAIQPASGSTAEALWAALTGNEGVFTISSTAVDDLTKTGPVANLVNASSLGSMFN